jgi:bla regulator protein blaR1
MTLNWIAYAIAVSVILSVAALAGERAARHWRLPTRWLWAAAMVASLSLPFALFSTPGAMPTQEARTSYAARPVSAYAPPVGKTASQWVARTTAPATIQFGPMLKPAVLALSATMLLALVFSAAMLALRRRRWNSARIDGLDVYVAPDAGPAVVGLLRPRIVLPSWLMEAPAQQRALVMAHERSHLEARDAQLLGLALLLLAAMPWNLPLWWQLRRLRRAIEVDCDARVLRAGHDLRQYGEALIDVGARHTGLIVGVVAMAESRSFLEQRLRIMVQAPGRWRKPAGMALAAMALCSAALAAQLALPEATRRDAVQLAPALLAEYEGTYQTEDFQAMVITPAGGRLVSEFTGRGPLLLTAEGKDHFSQPRSMSTLRFNRDAQGKVISLTVTRMGVELHAPRVDGAAMAARIAAHISRDGPMPGGEAALRRGADVVTTGKIFPEDLTPYFARISQQLMPKAMEQLRKKPIGKMKSITYEGINRDTGEDIYRVVYEKRAMDWYLLVNSDGKVANAWARMVPQ